MRAKHDAASGYYTTIATKISLADKVRLTRIAKGFNMTLYELMQALLLGITRYHDKGSTTTYEGKCLLEAIENIVFALKDSFNPIALKNRQQQHVCSAILLLQRADSKRPQLMEIRTDSQGKTIESYNYDNMLADILNSIIPGSLQRLKDEAKRQGYFSITQTLHEIIMQRTEDIKADTISAEVREMFTEVRIPTGQQINDDILYSRKKNVGDYTTATHKQYYRADL